MRSLMHVLPVSLALLTSAAAAQTGPVPSEPSLNAFGRGEVRVKPTRAIIHFTVQGRGATAALAAAENASLVAGTMKALAAAGLKPDAISNNSYNVGPDYEFSSAGRKQNGFVASNGIRVEVSRLADLGKIIDAGLGGGATQVSSAQYSGEKMEEARRDALKIAVDEARRDAEAMAAAAGGQLGRLLSLTSSGAMPNPREVELGRVAMSTVGGTAISPNDLTVVATASGRWEFIARK